MLGRYLSGDVGNDGGWGSTYQEMWVVMEAGQCLSGDVGSDRGWGKYLSGDVGSDGGRAVSIRRCG
jgi:hypothetical protein